MKRFALASPIMSLPPASAVAGISRVAKTRRTTLTVAQRHQQKQPPSPQAQIFVLQQQMALLQDQDANTIARAYDLATQLTQVQSQITALQAQLKRKRRLQMRYTQREKVAENPKVPIQTGESPIKNSSTWSLTCHGLA